MGIVDHETKEPFDDTTYEFHQCSFQDSKDEMEDLTQLLNDLHEENEFLKSNYKDLVQFVKSKGYTLKDFIDFIGQFQSIGVNKEAWE